MTPKLTNEQRDALNRLGSPVAIEDEETHRVYFLVDCTMLESLRDQADIAAILQGLADAEAGRLQPLDEAFKDIEMELRGPLCAMSRRVFITPTAKQHIQNNANWWAEHRSLSQALSWLPGVHAKIATLAESAESHALAHEAEQLGFELRELLFGAGRRPTHRILFRIFDDVVEVLAVRHTAQDDVTQHDLN